MKSPAQKCPICTDASARSVFTDPGAHVLECRSCGLRFSEHYPDAIVGDTATYGPEYFRKAIESWDERAAMFDALVAEVEGVLGHRGRLLDIGAAEGGLIKAAAGRGWQVEGTEIASSMVEFVGRELGFTMHLGELEALDLQGAHYDAVVMNHVLEHVREPVRALRIVKGLLAPDGVLRVEVPNVASLSARIKDAQSRLHLRRRPWGHYSTGHHYWFFTPRTLRRTLEAAGLRVIELRAPARQWAPLRPTDRVLNRVYRRWLLGGKLVAYARAGFPRDTRPR
jgi:2-polyprenyl-3-methyl-5-hydroxy-6-metoxy-1,4-benzoquinol methylase